MPPYLKHVVYRKATECRFCVCSPFACISTLTSNIPQRMPITGPGPHSLHVVTMTPLDACNASQMHSRCRLRLINLGAGVLIELERSLHYVWTCRIMHGVGGRKGIPTQVPFDLQTTREAFRALPRHVQKSAVMNITGVAVSGARKFHQWGAQWADQYCVLCQCQDTTQHRVFECPIGERGLQQHLSQGGCWSAQKIS